VPTCSGPEIADLDARRGLWRRALIGGAAAATATSVSSGLVQACRRSARPLKAPGSVLQPPNPPKGFTSRFMIMPGLAGHFRVIALDQRGRGLTSKAPPGLPGRGTTPAPSPATWPR